MVPDGQTLSPRSKTELVKCKHRRMLPCAMDRHLSHQPLMSVIDRLILYSITCPGDAAIQRWPWA
jgi:hypothetical protein